MKIKNININQNGQHMKANFFCVNCHGIGSKITHRPDCTDKEAYAIPSTAEVPRKKASKKKWDKFKEDYVYVEPVGYWFYSRWSWYEINGKKLK